LCVCTVPLFLPYHYVTIHHTRTHKLTCITWYPGYTAQGTLCINGLVNMWIHTPTDAQVTLWIPHMKSLY